MFVSGSATYSSTGKILGSQHSNWMGLVFALLVVRVSPDESTLEIVCLGADEKRARPPRGRARLVPDLAQVGAATPMMTGVFSILKGCVGVEERAIARALHFLRGGRPDHGVGDGDFSGEHEEQRQEWQAHREASMAVLVRRAMSASASASPPPPPPPPGRSRSSRRNTTSSYRSRRLQVRSGGSAWGWGAQVLHVVRGDAVGHQACKLSVVLCFFFGGLEFLWMLSISLVSSSELSGRVASFGSRCASYEKTMSIFPPGCPRLCVVPSSPPR